MIRRVRILRRAQHDLEQVAAYLQREAPEAADRILDDLLDAMEQLGKLPAMGPRPRDERLKRLGFRYLSRGRYLIFYKVTGTEVRIYRVLHERRAYDPLLH